MTSLSLDRPPFSKPRIDCHTPTASPLRWPRLRTPNSSPATRSSKKWKRKSKLFGSNKERAKSAMNNNQKKDLCLALMRADSEAEVVRILTEASYWGDKRVWRLYGDRENNFSTIGNQQNRPDAALVEKLINSVDARLMHE